MQPPKSRPFGENQRFLASLSLKSPNGPFRRKKWTTEWAFKMAHLLSSWQNMYAYVYVEFCNSGNSRIRILEFWNSGILELPKWTILKAEVENGVGLQNGPFPEFQNFRIREFRILKIFASTWPRPGQPLRVEVAPLERAFHHEGWTRTIESG